MSHLRSSFLVRVGLLAVLILGSFVGYLVSDIVGANGICSQPRVANE